jgi:hypothetical protein
MPRCDAAAEGEPRRDAHPVPHPACRTLYSSEAMTETESDPFFQLLTDALRAGPGSPQWGDAVARLRDGGAAGVPGGDEYAMLLRAREDIESGRDYRAVRAGPAFTRKVLDNIEQEGGRRQGIPTATLIAIASGLVILATVITVLVLMSGDGKTPEQAALDRLESTSFATAGASADFTAGVAGPPQGWRAIGRLPLDTAGGGLKAGPAPAAAPPDAAAFAGGGLVTEDPLPAGRAVSVEAEVVLPANATGTGSAQVFVSDSADFSPDRATSPREVVWIYRDGRVTVDADGRSQGEAVNLGAPGQTVKVRITFERDVAIVEAGNRRLYAGPHGLGPDAPRYAGVRFIRAAGEAGESAAFRSVDVAQSAESPAAGTAGGR